MPAHPSGGGAGVDVPASTPDVGDAAPTPPGGRRRGARWSTTNDVRAPPGDARLDLDARRRARPGRAIDLGPLEHEVPAQRLEVGVELTHPVVHGVVDVGEVVRVEHHPLHVDLAVAHRDLVVVAHGLDASARRFDPGAVGGEPVRGTAPSGRRPPAGPAPPRVVRRRTDAPRAEQGHGVGAERLVGRDQVDQRRPRRRATGARGPRPRRGRRGTACRRSTRYSARSVAAAVGLSAAAAIALGDERRRRPAARSWRPSARVTWSSASNSGSLSSCRSRL